MQREIKFDIVRRPIQSQVYPYNRGNPRVYIMPSSSFHGLMHLDR